MDSLTEKKFNKWFSVFVLAGMTIALIITTIFKLSDPQTTRSLLLFSAFGSLMGVLSTVCSANGLIITFLFGLLDVAIYGVICLIHWKSGGTGLGNAMLHFIYFVPMQFVGFAQWRRHKSVSDKKSVQPRRLTSKGWALCMLLFLVGSIVAYFIISRFDKSAATSFLKTAVILDVLPLMCNILGQLLMSMAYMEQWFFWIGVNIFTILMWATVRSDVGGSFAAIYIIKYSFYLINSFNGLRIWMKNSV